MAISRWYPIREMATLQNRMNSLFQDFSGENDPVTPPLRPGSRRL